MNRLASGGGGGRALTKGGGGALPAVAPPRALATAMASIGNGMLAASGAKEEASKLLGPDIFKLQYTRLKPASKASAKVSVADSN